MGAPHRPPGRPTQAGKVEIAERRAAAVKLRLGGWQYGAIAEELGYASYKHACDDISRAIKEIPRQATEELVATELARLDALLDAMWPKALEGSTWHVDRCLAIADRRARLLGLDKPTKVEVRTVDQLDEALQRLQAEMKAKAADVPVPVEQ